MEALFQRNVVPAEDFDWTEVVESGQGVELMKPRHDPPVFNVRQPADVKNKVRATSDCSKFIAGSLYVSVGQAQFFTG
jgi:hypothetical protein